MDGELNARSCPRGTPIACRDCDLNAICRLTGLISKEAGRLRQPPGGSRTLRPGALLYSAGTSARSIFAIREGMVKLTKLSPDGDERVVAYRTAGEVLGLEVFGTRSYAYDAIAVMPTQCCELLVPAIDTHAAQSTEISSALVALLSRANATQPMFTRGSARERVTSLLLDLASRMESRGFDGSHLNLGMSRLEIASLLDTRIETVSRTLQQLRRERAIDVRGNQVRLLALRPQQCAA